MQLRHLPLALLIVSAGACSVDASLSPADRPTPPPSETFDADLAFFDDNAPEPGGSTSSFDQALQTVATARADMQMLTLPEALLSAALTSPGTRDGDDWIWPFDTIVEGDPFSGELRATIDGDGYQWDLSVTAPAHTPVLSDFVLAQGSSDSRGLAGYWWLTDVEEGTDSVVAAISWIRLHDTTIDFAFSDSDSTVWTYETSQAGTVLTRLMFSQPRARVTWLPNGTGSSWRAGTVRACWNTDLYDVAC